MSDGTRRAARPNSLAIYKVGYGKPPKSYEFPPGHSGNPKGRPKGKKNTATLLREILDRKIEVRTGGRIKRISVREAMLTRFTESALKGDVKSAAFLLHRYDATEALQDQTTGAASRDEQEVIDAYLATHLKRTRERR